MGLLGGFFKAAVDVVTLPLAVVADVVTLGEADATGKVVRKLSRDLDEAGDAAAGGGGGFIAIMLTLLLAQGIAHPVKVQADSAQIAVGAAIGWLAPSAFDTVLPEMRAPLEPGQAYVSNDNSHARHIAITLLSIGTGLAYEAIRKQVDHSDFNLGNAYASSLGTVARISWSW